MGRKARKRNKLNKNTRNLSYKLKSSPSKFVLPAEGSESTDDSDNSLNTDNHEHVSTNFNHGNCYLNAQNSTVHSKKSAYFTSNSEYMVGDIATCLSTNKANSSKSILFTSAKESKSSVIEIDYAAESLISKEVNLFPNGEACSSISLINSCLGKLVISSPDDELESAIYDMADSWTRDASYSPESNTFIIIKATKHCIYQTNEASESLIDGKIESLPQNSDGESKSMILISLKNLHSLISRETDASESFRDRADSFGTSSFKRNYQLNHLPTRSKPSTTHPANEKLLPITNSSPVKAFLIDTESTTEMPLKVSATSSVKYEETLKLLYLKRKSFHKWLDVEIQWRNSIMTILECFVSFIAKFSRNSTFRKSKRNACIQNIYQKKLDEVIEYTNEILSEMDTFLEDIQHNCDFQYTKLDWLFEKVPIYESDETFFVDDEWKLLVEETLKRFTQIYDIRLGQLQDKSKVILKYVFKIKSIQKIF